MRALRTACAAARCEAHVAKPSAVSHDKMSPGRMHSALIKTAQITGNQACPIFQGFTPRSWFESSRVCRSPNQDGQHDRRQRFSFLCMSNVCIVMQFRQDLSHQLSLVRRCSICGSRPCSEHTRISQADEDTYDTDLVTCADKRFASLRSQYLPWNAVDNITNERYNLPGTLDANVSYNDSSRSVDTYLLSNMEKLARRLWQRQARPQSCELSTLISYA